jgi:hypothetical protein
VIVNLLAHTEFEITSETNVTVAAAPVQLSIAETAPVFGCGTDDAHVYVCAPGQVIDGDCESLTVMICVQIAVF